MSKEQFSRWIDGDLEGQEADQMARRCLASEDLRECWNTYHIIGDVLRNGRSGFPARTASILDALSKEPTVLAPTAMPAREPVRGEAEVLRNGRVKLAFAAAASAATVAAVGWIAMADRTSPENMIATQRAPVTPVAIPVAATLPADASREAIAAPVNDYFAAHRQVPQGHGMVPATWKVREVAAR